MVTVPNSSNQNSIVVEYGVFPSFDGSLTLDDIEKYIIQEVLNQTESNVAAAARILVAARETLRYRA